MSIAATIKKFDRKWQKVIITLTFPFLAALVLGLLFSGRLMNRVNNSLVYLAETNHLILLSRQYEKEFQLTRDTNNIDRFTTAYEQARNVMTQLKWASGLSHDPALISLEECLSRYRATFFKVADHYKLMGLDETSGLRGEFSRAAQDAEVIFEQGGDDTLFRQLMMCRRNEKDFLLRKQRRYVDLFQSNLAVLLDNVANAGIPPEVRSRVRVLLELYAQNFHGLVAAMNTIGLSSQHGLLAQMKLEADNLAVLLDGLNKALQRQRARVFGYLLLLIIPLLILIVHIAILLFKFMKTNERMLSESETRKKAQAELKRSHEELELRVAKRTAALTRSVQELEQHNREIALLGEMNDHLQVCQNQKETFPIIVRYGTKLFPSTAGGLYLYKASRVYLEQVVAWGDGLNSTPVFNPEDCWALRMGKTHRMDSDDQSISCRHRTNSNGSTYICQPLTAQGEVIGLLHIQFAVPEDGSNSSKPVTLKASTNRLIGTLAENMAMALSNLNLREVLRLQSIRDPLTGLFNRRYMEETFERELGRVQRNRAGLTVIMFDVDHFKKYNDSFGHHAGDAVLSQLGAFLKKNVRTEDIPCRYGGEEFILIMPGLSAEGALRRAEAVRKGIADMTIEHKGQPLNCITVSMGVAAFPTHGETAKAIIQAADEALYRAKRNGRNRSFMASNIPRPQQDTTREAC